MSEVGNITYSPTAGATPDQALDVRIRAWAFILDCHAKKEAAPESRPDNAKGSLHDRAKQSIPRG